MSDGWVTAEVEKHVSCGAPGTPHATAVYHPDGHTVVERVRIRLVADEKETHDPAR